MAEHCNPLHNENYTAHDYDGLYPWNREMDLENRNSWWDAWTGDPKLIRKARDLARVRVAGNRIDQALEGLLLPILEPLNRLLTRKPRETP